MSDDFDQKTDTDTPLLDAVAAAQTPTDLLAAHRQIQRAIHAQRRKSQKVYGPLAQAFADAMALIDQQAAAGVPREERLKGLEGVLRSVWPGGRGEAWHYLCESCDDTGLVFRVCKAGARCNGISTRTDSPGGTPGKYRRLCAQHPTSSYEHTYGVPCTCPKGSRFRAQPKPAPEDFTQAGRSKPMTRVGRR